MSDISWLFSLSPLIAFTCNFLSQVMISRISSNVSLFVLTGLANGSLVLFLLIAASPPCASRLTFYSYCFSCILTYLSLSFCYWGFLNLNRTSLRIRILRELLHASSDCLSKDTLLSIYSPRELLNARLNRLTANNKIFKNNDNKWELTKGNSRELFILAYILAFLRKIIIPSRKQHESPEY